MSQAIGTRESNCFVEFMRKRFRGRMRSSGKMLFIEIPDVLQPIANVLCELDPDGPHTRSQVAAAIRELNLVGEDLGRIAELVQELIDNEEEADREAFPTPLDRLDAEYSDKFPWRLQGAGS